MRRSGAAPRKTTRAAGAALAAAGVLGLAAPVASAAGPGESLLASPSILPVGALSGGESGEVDDSSVPSPVSTDGRYVAFVSRADTLVPGAPVDSVSVFRKDRTTGAVVLVNRATGADGAVPVALAHDPRISGDGTLVTWRTSAALDAADVDDRDDVYVRDLATNVTTLVTPGTTEDVTSYDLAADGSAIAFSTRTAPAGLATTDTNNADDVYRRQLAGGATVLVSRSFASGTTAGNAGAYGPSISSDGRWVAFAGGATNLTAAFTNNNGTSYDVFVRDADSSAGGDTTLVSASTGSATAGASNVASRPDIAGTATSLTTLVVAYGSEATNVSADDASSSDSTFVRRLGNPDPSSVLISRADGPAGPNASSRAHIGGISDDGRYVIFASDATNLSPGAVYYGVYLRDRTAGTTKLVSASTTYAVEGAISGDGEVGTWFEGGGVTADSDPDQGGFVFARTLKPDLGPITLASRPAGSAPFLGEYPSLRRPGTNERSISDDGRYVVFAASSSRLPGGAPDGRTVVYRRDLRTGVLTIASRRTGADGALADEYVGNWAISGDGSRIAFETSAKLDDADTDTNTDVYVRDLGQNTTRLASRADGAAGAKADTDVQLAGFGADGRRVGFRSDAGNLGVAGGTDQLWVRDLESGATILASRATTAGGAAADDDVSGGSLSADGRRAVFAARATNLSPDDPTTDYDVYLRDLTAATTTLLSRRDGVAGTKAAGFSDQPAISGDGRIVAFRADDPELVPGAGTWTGGNAQIVARDVDSAANVLVSRAQGGAPADHAADAPSVSTDGSVVAFESSAENLLAGRGGGSRDAVYAKRLGDGALLGPAAYGLVDNAPQNRATEAFISGDGQCLAHYAVGHGPASGTAGDVTSLYVHVVSGSCPKPEPAPPVVFPIGDPPVPVPISGTGAPRPVLTGVAFSPNRFRVGPKATPATKAKKAKKVKKVKKAKVGTTIRFTLNTPASVTVAIARRTTGRKVGKTCRKATRKLRKRKACVRYVPAGTLTRKNQATGRRTIAFTGRIGRKALATGRYRATFTAKGTGGTAKAVVRTFTVVKR